MGIITRPYPCKGPDKWAGPHSTRLGHWGDDRGVPMRGSEDGASSSDTASMAWDGDATMTARNDFDGRRQRGARRDEEARLGLGPRGGWRLGATTAAIADMPPLEALGCWHHHICCTLGHRHWLGWQRVAAAHALAIDVDADGCTLPSALLYSLIN